MKKKFGRSPIKMIESPSLSQILFLIANGKNYAQKIAEIKGIKPSPVIRQLNKLKKFLNSKNEPLLNKTIYSIRWDKIAEEFYLFHFPEKCKRGTTALNLNEIENKKWFEDPMSFPSAEKMKDNLYLQNFLKAIFESIDDNKDDGFNIDTLKELFSAIPNIFISIILSADEKEEKILSDKKDKDINFKNFLYFMTQSYATSYKMPLQGAIKDGTLKFLLNLNIISNEDKEKDLKA